MLSHFSAAKEENLIKLPLEEIQEDPSAPFPECWSVRIIHRLPDATPDYVRCQFRMAYQLILQSRQSPGINIQ